MVTCIKEIEIDCTCGPQGGKAKYKFNVGDKVNYRSIIYSSGFGSPDPNYTRMFFTDENGDHIAMIEYDACSERKRKGYRPEPEISKNRQMYFKDVK